MWHSVLSTNGYNIKILNSGDGSPSYSVKYLARDQLLGKDKHAHQMCISIFFGNK